ncbi:MAG: hypothetical protein ACTHLT_06530 [Devosia sp.]
MPFALVVPGRDRQCIEMIKTFSLSALFFMALGVACATHMGLPF